MFREMRRIKQVLSLEDSIKVLTKGTSGVLALSGDDGYPYAVPMSYVYCDSKIFFHCAQTGHKIDAIKNNHKASFCVIDEDTIVPEEYTTYFRSVIAFGKIRVLDEPTEKRKALEVLAAKYSPDQVQGREEEIDGSFDRVCVLELCIEHMSGKEAIELVKKDFRKTYDAIPEQFDKWRSRYCDELFHDVIEYAKIDESKSVLEIGLGTGQATEPFLKTGCDYMAIELGENFVDFTKNKFNSYDNFNVVHGDFETYDFGNKKFDLIYSAATIQWIPEKVGFPKIYNLLKSGGTLAMFMTRTDEKTPNGALYDQIKKVYDKYFHVETKYTCKLKYDNVVNYGFVDYNYRDWKRTRVYNADEYVEYLASTKVEHITLKEPYKSNFYNGISDAIKNAGNKIVLNDTIALYLVKKP